MNEPEVISKTHAFLKSHPLGRRKVLRLYTDAHPSLFADPALDPFQRFTLDLGDFVMHPDLVGQLDDGETLLAVEAKGESDHIKGLAQAEIYQYGFHYSFFAAYAGSLNQSLIRIAQKKNIGVLAVDDDVQVAHFPEAQMPLREPHRLIQRQMEGVIQVTSSDTFTYNVPTHYLAWAIALEPDRSYGMAQVPREIAGYPMPRDWKPALQGAQKLGLVRVHGEVVELTPVGEAAKRILPQRLEAWAEVHKHVGTRSREETLARHYPQAAALLRLLLLQDRIVRLIIEGLEQFPDKTATFAELAIVCDSLDHATAPVFFLLPQAVPELEDERGRIQWSRAREEHYRSRSYYQFKSILKHAGILQPTALGSDSTNIWALI